MKSIITLILFCSTFSISWAQISDNENFFYDLSNKIKEYRISNPQLPIFLITDKNAYAPGEKIKYGILNQSYSNNYISLNINKLHFFIFDSNGNIIAEKITNLNTAICIDSMILPETIASGIYNIVYYSSVMENDSFAFFYKKHIEIREHESEEFNIKINYNNPLITVLANDSLGNPLPEVSINITSNKKEHKALKFSSKTNQKGIASFEITKDQLGNTPIQLICEAKFKNERSTITSNIIPDTKLNNVDFVVEGNALIAGMPKLISVTATDSFNRPKAIEGEISDEDGNVLANYKTDSTGRGYFYIITPKDKSLKASIKGESINCYSPQLSTKGASMTFIKIQNDSVFLKMESQNSLQEQKFKVALISNEKVYWGSIATIKFAGIVKLPIKDVPKGVAEILLFNYENEVIAQRLVFITSTTNKAFEISSLRNEYTTKDSVAITVKPNISPTSFITSIIESNTSVTTNNPFAEIEPYLLNQINPKASTINELNHELASNKLFQELPNNIFNLQIASKAEKTTKITGFVIDRKNNPVPNADVNVLQISSGSEIKITSDKNGWFEIASDSINEEELNITASTNKGNKKQKVILIDIYKANLQQLLKSQNILSTNNQTINNKIKFTINKTDLLAYALEQKKINDKQHKQRNSKPEEFKNHNSSKSVLDLIAEIKPYSLVDQKIIFPSGITSNRSLFGARFIVDGFLKSDNIGEISNLTTSDIARIRVLTNPSDIAIYTSFAANGLIEITTKGHEIENSKSIFEIKQKNNISKNNYLFKKLEINNQQPKTITLSPNKNKGNYIFQVFGLTQDGAIINETFNFQLK